MATTTGSAAQHDDGGPDGWRTPAIEDADHPAHGAEHRASLNALQHGFAELHHQLSLTRNQQLRPAGPAQREKSPVARRDVEDDAAEPLKLSLKGRIKHVTWAWFTLTMATGGISNVLYQVPFRFHGLQTIGVIFFLLNIVLYVIIWAMLLARFWFYPATFKASFRHPTESLFVVSFAVSFGTILINIVEYGFARTGSWLHDTVVVLFWFDAGLAFCLSIAIYLILWSTQSFTIARMTPIWIFPAYPLLIIGPHASVLSSQLDHPLSSLQIIVGGFTIQGIGFLVSLTIYAAFVYRLMTQKLPADPLRPGMFVSVGPSAFTVSGVMGMAENLGKIFDGLPGNEYMGVPAALAASILRLVANWVCLWLWGLALWFFFVSLVSNLECFRAKHHVSFAMTWFSFVFPQTALITSTFAVAKAFDLYALKVIGCVMTCMLILMWFFVVSMMIRAIVRRQILWPERGEDKTEGGFKHADNSTNVVEKARRRMRQLIKDET